MELFPAIDIQGQQVVRLTHGDFAAVQVYDNDPVAVAVRFAQQGAKNLHVVDLDAARSGEAVNRVLLKRIAQESGLFVQVGGGIRSEDVAAEYLAAGVGRIIVGTAALEQPDFLRRLVQQYAQNLAVGVDVRNGMVATHGWLKQSTVEGAEFCRTLQEMGVQTVIYTDIARDGAMQGTNLPLYRTLQRLQGMQLIASGGISTYAELRALRDMGVYGAIVGKALYTGAMTLTQALREAAGTC